MNRRCAVCVFVLLFPLAVFAKTPETRLRPFVPLLIEKAQTITMADWTLSVEPAFGITYGELGEYVYEQDGNGDYQKLSYLAWQERPLWTFGATVFGAYKRLGLRAFVESALPLRCGTMKDSDWMNLDSMKTTYSISENTLARYIDFSLALTYELHPLSWLYFSPLVDFSYSYRDFSAENGYGWYGQSQNPYVPWDDPKATYFGAGQLCGIDYTRYSVAAFIGGTVQCNLPHSFSVVLSAAISPITYVESLDKHYQNFQKSAYSGYLDIAYCYWSRVKGSVAVYCAITPTFSVGITCSGIAGWLVQGKTYTKHADGIFYETTGAKSGADIYEATVRISCKIQCI